MKLKTYLILFAILGGVLLTSPVLARGRLVKTANDPSTYYIDGNSTRHLFPTENTYYSWYDDFSEVEIISWDEIVKSVLGENIKVRSGKGVISFETDNRFYAVEPGGILREFDDYQIIEDIYGEDWSNRVITIVDGFYNDYTIGEKINRSYDMPNGVVYQLEETFYYKKKGILWPFDSWSSVLDNGFKKDDLVIGDRRFFKRQKLIDGLDDQVFNPAEEIQLENSDCENKKLKIAIALVAGDDFSILEIEKINAIKNKLKGDFKWATQGLVELDISFPIIVLGDDQYLFSQDDGKRVVDNEAINVFYDSNPDVFDFIVLYNNFILDEELIANYVMINNNFKGTGRNQLNIAENFGSGGKLKGIANMGNLDKYDTFSNSGLNQAVNLVIHELSHHWTGRARFINDAGEISTDLLTDDLGHWNSYVDFISPLGANGWVDNGDGSYTNQISLMTNSSRRQFSDLDLYFMGLFPNIAIDSVRYLVPENEGEVSNTLRGEMKEVSMEQIVGAMGGWSCKI
jgi:hypothetical protein